MPLQLTKIGESRRSVSPPREKAPADLFSAPIPVPVPLSAQGTSPGMLVAPPSLHFPTPAKRIQKSGVAGFFPFFILLVCLCTASWWMGKTKGREGLMVELKNSRDEIALLKHERILRDQEIKELKTKTAEPGPENSNAPAPRGKVTAKSDPPGALLAVVGAGSVTSPGTIFNVKTGKRFLWATLEGCDPVEKEIQVEDQKTLDAGTLSLSRHKLPVDAPWLREQEKKDILLAEKTPSGVEGRFTQEEARLLISATDEINAERPREALQSSQEVLKTKPQCVTALVRMGFVLFEMKDFEGAEEYFRRAIAQDDRDSYCHELLGSALFEQGHYEESLASFNHALTLKPQGGKPDGSFSWYYLGRINQEKGNMDAAEKSYLKALEIKPGYGDAHIGLARFYLSQKPPFPTLAREHYQKARELNAAPDLEIEKALAQ